MSHCFKSEKDWLPIERNLEFKSKMFFIELIFLFEWNTFSLFYGIYNIRYFFVGSCFFNNICLKMLSQLRIVIIYFNFDVDVDAIF